MSQDSRTRVLTEHLRRYESKLYAIRDDFTKAIHVMREGYTMVGPYEINGLSFKFSQSTPHYICALTDNWSASGSPRDWGIDQVISHLQEIDCWNRATAIAEMRAEREKHALTKNKDRMNQHEDFFRENRNVFKKALGDFNASSHFDIKEYEREIESKMERN